jgi:hypothetical protein
MVTSLLAEMVAVAVWSAAARPARSAQPTYIGLGLLTVLLVILLIKAYRVWEEIHDVEEPDSAEDLLASFERAHAEGELDDEELERVKARLRTSPTVEGPATGSPAPDGAGAPTMRGSALDQTDEPSAARDGAGEGP